MAKASKATRKFKAKGHLNSAIRQRKTVQKIKRARQQQEAGRGKPLHACPRPLAACRQRALREGLTRLHADGEGEYPPLDHLPPLIPLQPARDARRGRPAAMRGSRPTSPRRPWRTCPSTSSWPAVSWRRSPPLVVVWVLARLLTTVSRRGRSSGKPCVYVSSCMYAQ